MKNLLWDLILIVPLHVTNDLVFLLMRFRMLGVLHDHDRLVSKNLIGANRTYLGAVVIIAATTTMYSFLLGRLCFWPGIGMVTGTYLNSFLKRRLRIKEGGSLPVFDQLDFIVGGIVGLAVCGLYIDNLLLIMAISFIVHVISNICAYAVGMKKIWW